jgi:hypothetical protein
VLGKKSSNYQDKLSCKGCGPPSIVQHVETGMNVFAHRNLSRAPNGTRLSRRYVPQVPTQIAAQCIPVYLYETIEQLLYDPAPRSTQLCSGLISKICGVCRMASLGSSEKYGSTFFRKSDLGQNLHQNYNERCRCSSKANLKLLFQLWSVITNNVVETKLSTCSTSLSPSSTRVHVGSRKASPTETHVMYFR